MQEVPLGNTGVRVSKFCLGAMRFGWATPKETSLRLLDRYVEAGGGFIDTANIYGAAHGARVGAISEELLGEWMRDRGNRSELFIASKVGFHYEGVERGLRAEQIEAECNKSLRRLGIETLDLYYAHVDDRKTPMEESLEAFDRLVSAGKVRLIGASNFFAWRLERANCISEMHGWAAYCCVQQRHSYLRKRPGATFDPQIASNEDLFDYCRDTGTTLLAYSPLLGGTYTRTDRPLREQYVGPDTDARLSALRAVAEERGATANQVVLAWMAQSDPPVIPLVAASTVAQMDENLGALDLILNADQMARLSDAAA